MEDQSTHIILFIFFNLLLLDCSSLDTISSNQEIKDGNTLVSEGGMFELGFFSPGKSKNWYLGIWFKKISNGTVVWVANRETPITDASGILKFTENGNLMILNSSNSMVWSSNSTVVSMASNHNPVMLVKLLDTGNLVVWRKNQIIWQSFDYLTDTFLPGMKFGKNLVTGLEWVITSWKSPDDPSMGQYNNIVDTNGYPQTFMRHGQVLLSRFGPWNGLGFSGFPIEKENRIYSAEFVVNDKEIYHRFTLKGSVVHRVVLTWDGKTLFLQWVERIREWIVYAEFVVDNCDSYARCGPYGICSINKHPPCICMQGFEPRNPKAWEASDWESGCIRKKPLNRANPNGDKFWKLVGVKVPDTRGSWYNVRMTLAECEMTCRGNWSCTAYASLDIRNGGSGCLLWFNELMDTREFDANQDIYIRMDATELEGLMNSRSNFNRKKRLLVLLLLTSSGLPLIFAMAYACRTIMKSRQIKGRGKRTVLDEEIEHLDDLQIFSLFEVARATSNFSDSNKIGEGGFGPVYKGMLEGGREIAVKRLSETSQQGLDEFKNEVICVAKLQHRNLVKLLGYCIHQNELVLIYEYMTNKSLDFFLFDEHRCLMLNWPQRFNIIHGIARGILYLHQDSRLQIIHRDLKASNILLDCDMNPKISDFGLARKFVGHDTTAKTKKVVGTYGYISPEYAVHGRFSTKSDVYSFGVMVLEIVCGKKNREFSYEEHGDNLPGYAWRLYKEGRSIELMSESLRSSSNTFEVLRSIHVALLCVQNRAEDRPTMLSIVMMLVSEGTLLEPRQPAFFNESCHKVETHPSVSESLITLVYPQ